jgi:cell wall-associated NlpC family hydrolase
MTGDFLLKERQFQRLLLRSVGAPYRFGGRGMAGIDCSSLLLRAIRGALRQTVSKLPWMTANQMARGYHDITIAAATPDTAGACVLAFFDWDEDQAYEHCAARLLDESWVWASTSAGKVIHVDPRSGTIWDRQWREIEGALNGSQSTLRLVNWSGLRK